LIIPKSVVTRIGLGVVISVYLRAMETLKSCYNIWHMLVPSWTNRV